LLNVEANGAGLIGASLAAPAGSPHPSFERHEKEIESPDAPADR
jgi:hypothetical protein